MGDDLRNLRRLHAMVERKLKVKAGKRKHVSAIVVLKAIPSSPGWGLAI
jgi:hypothetical protein